MWLEGILRRLAHIIYRIRVVGQDAIPARGGALIVANHPSFVDPILLIASLDRPVRFLMHETYYRHFALNPFARMLGAIPISADVRPRAMGDSLTQAGRRVAAGEIVCIFAEGEVTRSGEMGPFRRGLETIMKGVDAPIIPAALCGVWGSIFSNAGGRFLWKVPRRIPYPVTILFGPPMRSTARAAEVREAVADGLASECAKPALSATSPAWT